VSQAKSIVVRFSTLFCVPSKWPGSFRYKEFADEKRLLAENLQLKVIAPYWEKQIQVQLVTLFCMCICVCFFSTKTKCIYTFLKSGVFSHCVWFEFLSFLCCGLFFVANTRLLEKQMGSIRKFWSKLIL